MNRIIRHLSVLSLAVAAAWQSPESAIGSREATVPEGDAYCLRLGSAVVVPESGLHAAAAERGEPFLIQFRRVPTFAERSTIERAGFDLVQYVGGRSYVARCKAGCSDSLTSLPIRSTLDLTPSMKLAPVFQTDANLRTRLNSRLPLEVVVRFYPWVSWERGRLVLEQSGALFDATGFGFRSTVVAMVDGEVLHALLSSTETAWVDPALPATGRCLTQAAQRSRVDQVRGVAEFLGVDGSGTSVGILDWFPADIHTDFADRVTPVDVRWDEDEHGAEVSGCVAGEGILDPRATGMAPGASLFWTSWVPDPWTAMGRFHDEYDVTIVNNSWNTKPGWWLPTRSWHGDLWAFGYYHERAGAADALVRNTDLLVLFSAGNKRQISLLGPHTHGDQFGNEDGVWHEDLHPLNPSFRSIAGAAVAKNVLTVGGTTKDDNVDPYSSFGPTDDGRVKPDLVAVGLDVLTTGADDGYIITSGTSISSAVVAGVAALITDYSRRRHGRDPSSSVLKNVLIHSARDLGEPGPDYRFGFGIADAELAARVLDGAVFDEASFQEPRRPTGRRSPVATKAGLAHDVGTSLLPDNGMRSLVIEDSLDQGESSTYMLPVAGGCEELRATLVWHDPPGPELVNDLDLRAVAPNGNVIRPFVLDPEQPSGAAVRGINYRDNVEQIRVATPMAGWWRIVVDGSEVPDGPQELALIASAGEGNRAPLTLTEGDVVIDEFFVTGDSASNPELGPWSEFRDGDPINFYIEGTIIENADYGGLFGSIALTTSVSDTDGDTVFRFTTAGHNSGPGPLQFLLEAGSEIPAELPAGNYTAHAELAMHNGVRRTADYPFTVDPPS